MTMLHNPLTLGHIVLLLLLLCRPLSAVDSSDADTDGSSSYVVELTDDSFERLTQASTGATTGDWLVEFYAPWCGHCQRLEPIWEEVAVALSGSINVARMDVTAHPTTVKRFDVQSLPHIVCLSRGRLFEYDGSRDKNDLMQFAYDKLNRHSQPPVAGQDNGKPVPAPPTALAVLSVTVLEWAGQLHTTLTTRPAVSAALVCIGVLVGVLITLLAFALLLPNHSLLSHKAPTPQSNGAGKARKAD